LPRTPEKGKKKTTRGKAGKTKGERRREKKGRGSSIAVVIRNEGLRGGDHRPSHIKTLKRNESLW